ncbi:MAG TPA: helix-turn-helix transcriptional regulator [Streptosporangiaceae bacterium]
MAGSDDIARTVAIMAGQFALSGDARKARQTAGLTMGEVAKATGTTPGIVSAWESGLARPSQGEALAWMSLLTDRQIARAVSYAGVMRAGHAGGDIRGGAPEYSIEAVSSSVDQLRAGFPDWTVELPSGHKSLGSDKPARLVWKATRHDWPDVYAATAAELRSKLEDVERSLEADAKKLADFNSGRGVRGTRVR